ncbi:hypothetical protein CSB45_06040 [candidate division KSB3 bacterium]|uniref:Ice-binding protein C-terminal domain-containing protein n=1 Tax=candidate division KSB3 bacterium TaxID=2044937 RepID=A0A2G6E6R0_9BACT|nr:MAG: hypothetical protein CSB45_06040 [candidate division KSB3 bacterium]PIE30208.1 MAG: hypothetical protein CSA57_04755 [candidate division KSB3 bacterium]
MKSLLTTLSLATLLITTAGLHHSVALDLGTDITIADLNSRGEGWYGDREDQETEPGTITNQSWDLEGMFLRGSQLSLVGGYDFRQGEHKIYTGDIFIDVDGDIVYGQDITTLRGNGYQALSNSFGYDYVIDLTLDGNTLSSSYDVYQLDASATLLSPYYRLNDESGAFRYVAGGELIGSGDVFYQSGLSDAELGFLGGRHNVLSVDLSFLNPGTAFTAHYTMGCGNDDLMGSGSLAPTATPEPGTLLLLSSGMFAVIGLLRKRCA